MATYFTMEICEKERASKRVPEDFYCLEYRSEKFIDYAFPADKSHHSSLVPQPEPQAAPPPADPSGTQTRNDDVLLAGGRYHYSRPLFMWVDGELPPEKITGLDPEMKAIAQNKPKRVARRTQPRQQFDPIGAFVARFTPRDY